MLDRRPELRREGAYFFPVVERGGQGLGSRNLNPQRWIPTAHRRHDPLGATVLARYAIGISEDLGCADLPQAVRKPADVVLCRSVGDLGNEHEVGDAQGSPDQL